MTQTWTSIVASNVALLNLGANNVATTTAACACPTDQPIGNGGYVCPAPTSTFPSNHPPRFEPTSLTPWIPLTAGVVTSGRVTGGASLSGFAYKFSIDAANPNLPQRLIQPVTLCSNSTYSLSFKMRQTTVVGTISVIGSMQAGAGARVQMAGGLVPSSLYVVATGIGNLVVPVGTGAVAAVVVIEALFGPVGTLAAKEVYVDEIVLTKIA
jgi:hypothetical protein